MGVEATPGRPRTRIPVVILREGVVSRLIVWMDSG
jgi:hypothetical protein